MKNDKTTILNKELKSPIEFTFVIQISNTGATVHAHITHEGQMESVSTLKGLRNVLNDMNNLFSQFEASAKEDPNVKLRVVEGKKDRFGNVVEEHELGTIDYDPTLDDDDEKRNRILKELSDKFKQGEDDKIDKSKLN